MLLTKLEQKIRESGWKIEKKEIDQWCKKASSLLNLYVNEDESIFQQNEIFHYLTERDVISGTVDDKRDEKQVKELFYQTNESKVGEARKEELQSPDKTFGEVIKSVPCLKCGSDTRNIAIQKRSADEPMRYELHCTNSKCGRVSIC